MHSPTLYMSFAERMVESMARMARVERAAKAERVERVERTERAERAERAESESFTRAKVVTTTTLPLRIMMIFMKAMIRLALPLPLSFQAPS